MTIPFTANEIQKAIAKMKSNKSPGFNEILVMAETGDITKEVMYGIL